jgi:hypothetical protein
LKEPLRRLPEMPRTFIIPPLLDALDASATPVTIQRRFLHEITRASNAAVVTACAVKFPGAARGLALASRRP